MVHRAPPIDLWWRACDHYSRCLKGCCPKPINISICTLCRICTLYSTKNDTCLRKPFCCCSDFPLQTHLLRHKRSSRRHECNPGRSVSEAAPRFRNLYVYEPSTLRKKPSTSSEKPLILGRSLPICGTSCAASAFQKSIPNVGVIFFDF